MITLENQIKVSERDLLKEVEDNKVRKRSSDKVLAEKNLQISEIKKQLDEGLQASKEQLEELRDDLKNVQSERLEASRQNESLRNKVSNLQKKLSEAVNKAQEEELLTSSKSAERGKRKAS